MLEFIAGLAVGAATILIIAVTLGARWRRNRRRVDEAHAAMLQAVWDVQDKALRDVILSRGDLNALAPEVFNRNIERADLFAALQDSRNAAAARYFAAVGE